MTVETKYAGTGSTRGSGNDWYLPIYYVGVPDAYWAAGPIVTRQLVGSNFGFIVPDGSTVSQIRAGIHRSKGLEAGLQDLTVRLFDGLVLIGANHAGEAGDWIATYPAWEEAIYVWNPPPAAATPAVLRSADFGIVLAATSGFPTQIAYAESVWIEISYTPPTPMANHSWWGPFRWWDAA